jgi:dTDP-4-amino-4,6-dideoxygalactose transaminase
MKVPTTLGGGILITKDSDFAEKIRINVAELYSSTPANKFFVYHLKGIVSILNSYPWLYSSLSHQVFGLIKKRNPSLLRRILYSGMGMNEQRFDPHERPPLAAYQTAVGAVQFSRAREMTNIRRRHSTAFDEHFVDHPDTTVLPEAPGIFWNYQYHVIDVGDHLDRVFHYMFSKGIHVMKEDVWDCTAYGFPGIERTDFLVARSRNRGLLRLPNNSFLSGSQIKGIAQTLLGSLS